MPPRRRCKAQLFSSCSCGWFPCFKKAHVVEGSGCFNCCQGVQYYPTIPFLSLLTSKFLCNSCGCPLVSPHSSKRDVLRLLSTYAPAAPLAHTRDLCDLPQIQETWKIVEKDLDNHAVKFYKTMLELGPAIKQLFVTRSRTFSAYYYCVILKFSSLHPLPRKSCD